MSQSTIPPQHQDTQPGHEAEMTPRPRQPSASYRAADHLRGKVALITGGDSGIGRAVAIAFAKEGAEVAVVYLNEHDDARETVRAVEAEGSKVLAWAGDIGDESFCRHVVERTIEEFGHLDVLVNNAGEQHPQKRLEDLTSDQLERTFRTNLFSMFYLTKAALAHLKCGAAIVNTASVTAYEGSADLIDYSATKGAIVAFTRSLALQLSPRGIRVNAVAPGPIWTPLIPASYDAQRASEHGQRVPMKRPGQPVEVAPAYVYLASDQSSYVSGQTVHVNGGTVVNG